MVSEEIKKLITKTEEFEEIAKKWEKEDKDMDKISTKEAIAKIRCSPKALKELTAHHAFSNHSLKESLKLQSKIVDKCVSKKTRKSKKAKKLDENGNLIKKKLSKYNQHMSDCPKTYKSTISDHKERFKQCIADWNRNKKK